MLPGRDNYHTQTTQLPTQLPTQLMDAGLAARPRPLARPQIGAAMGDVPCDTGCHAGYLVRFHGAHGAGIFGARHLPHRFHSTGMCRQVERESMHATEGRSLPRRFTRCDERGERLGAVAPRLGFLVVAGKFGRQQSSEPWKYCSQHCREARKTGTGHLSDRAPSTPFGALSARGNGVVAGNLVDWPGSNPATTGDRVCGNPPPVS